jgi:hemoglobin-like flavoprotein
LNGKTEINISDVFEEIRNAFDYYIDFGSERISDLIACWVIGTYFHRQFKTYPYIHFIGDMEAGKTKTATLISCLSFNGELTFNSTPPYIISAIHNNHSTCCVDEAERLKDNKEQDSQIVISMYNAGYKKGNFCGKREQIGNEGKWVNKKFEAYSPKVFASIKGMPASLASRCLPITMYKSGNKEIQNREIDISDPIFQKIRDSLYVTLFDNHIQIKFKYNTITDEEIFGREWELAKPILTIAKVIDDKNNSKFSLYSSIRNKLLEIQKLKKEARIEETITPKLLVVLHEHISGNPAWDKFYSISDLVNVLIDSGEETFSWLGDDKKNHGRGRWLSNALRTAGVIEGKAIQKKVDGKNAKGFQIDLENVNKRLKNFEIEIENAEKV